MESILTSPQPLPSVFTIPSHYPFLTGLAKGLLQWTHKNPAQLASLTLYLPYREAERAFKEILLQNQSSVFLPKIVLLDDLEKAYVPSMGSFAYKGLLTTLIQHYHPCLATAAKLAQDLIDLMNQAAFFGVSFDNLASLVPKHLAQHWQVTLDFLKIITQHWPLILKAHEAADPYQTQVKCIENKIQSWKQNPPQDWMIAAGSTGSIPIMSQWIETIAHLPQGSVILPGIEDRSQTSELGPTHPQKTLQAFRARLSLETIPIWPHLPPKDYSTARSTLAQQTFDDASPPDPVMTKKALQGLSYIPCPTPRLEALVIALILRQTLEEPDTKTLVVSPCMQFNQRLSCELNRWNIKIEDSAGTPLDSSLAGSFLRLILQVIVDNFQPITLLSLLKHPLLLETLQDVWTFEVTNLRRHDAALSLQNLSPESEPLLTKILEIIRPLKLKLERENISLEGLVTTHKDTAQALCPHLWDTEDGIRCQQLFQDLEDQSSYFPTFQGKMYPLFFQNCLKEISLAPSANVHPRLKILSPRQARLLSADTVILAGFNEGSWPPSAEPDPWLNRSIRNQLGLPQPEQNVSLACYDFCQIFSSSKKIFITRSLSDKGNLSIPSRILMRLESTMELAGCTIPQDKTWLQWAQALDESKSTAFILPPAPCPPIGKRPRKISVTQVELWKKDPYAFYARYILNLKSLEPLDNTPNQARWGILIHKILERFIASGYDPSNLNSLPFLIDLGSQELQDLDHSIQILLWPRLKPIIKGFLSLEQAKRQNHSPFKTWTEIQGALTFPTPYGSFTVTARADRIDWFKEEQSIDIIDYKTGALPTERDVQAGLFPQMPLQAAIALANGFPSIKVLKVRTLQFWQLKSQGCVIKTLSKQSPEIYAKEALDDLESWVKRFDNEETPYSALETTHPHPDYTHLARRLAWKQS